MSVEEMLRQKIVGICNKFIDIYGESSLSKDEQDKFDALPSVYNQTKRGRLHVLQELNFLEKQHDEKDYVDLSLTFFKCLAENIDLFGPRWQRIDAILVGFNSIPTDEYKTYEPLITNIKLLNHIHSFCNSFMISIEDPVVMENRNNAIKYAINRYREDCVLNGNDSKKTIDGIIKTIDKKEFIKGRTIK